MWQVIVGGLLAILGGFLSNLYIDYQNRKNRKYDIILGAYKKIIDATITWEDTIIKCESIPEPRKFKFIDTEIEVFASSEVLSLYHQYISLVERKLGKEINNNINIDEERDTIRKALVKQIRKELNKKFGGIKNAD